MGNSSRTRQDMDVSVNWAQQQQRTCLEDLEIPKFKSFAPSSLAVSPCLVSPSSFSPSVFLDSPAFVSSSTNVLASPTTGALITHDSSNQKGRKEEEKNSFFGFSFQTQPVASSAAAKTGATSSSSSSLFPSTSTNFVSQEQHQQEPWNSMKAESQTGATQKPVGYYSGRNQRKAEDGYNWRKYGQKQVKGSENPRSYYKCSYPNCPTKKKVETCLDGQITEIVYKGSHNHPKPQSTRRSFHSTKFGSSDKPISGGSGSSSSGSFHQTDSYGMQQEDNTSGSVGDEEFELGSSVFSREEVEEDDCSIDPEGKRWKGETETDGVIGNTSRTVREPRIVVQTTSDIDILDDGYRWRKYGQKVVKGNPNPRSYYKCTTMGCPVRKQVERASHDTRAVITTYEGRHNHDVPAPRGSGYSSNRSLSDSNGVAAVPFRPAAIAGGHSSYTVSQPPPYTLEMVQNPNAKEEPNDFSFFDSFLS